jgi:hypothetical protein
MLGRVTFLGFLLVFVSIALGCSGGADNPIAPNAGGLSPRTSAAQPDSGNRYLWGLWDIAIDPNTGSAEILPVRGACFTANVNSLLEGAPGNMIIEDMDLSDFVAEGRLDCTVTLKHPFSGLDQFDGFDVWGVFLHNGSTPLGYDGLEYSDGSGSNEAVLLNPDGYTRWFNYPEFHGTGMPIFSFTSGKLSNLPNPSATLNPYRIYADNLDEEEDFHAWISQSSNAEDRGIFRAGQVNSRRYELKFPMVGGVPLAEFQYAVIASWEKGDPTLTGNPSAYDPGDFPAVANCEEAFFVRADASESDMFNDGTGNLGGSFKAAIEVFDWQGGSVSNNGVPNEVESIIIIGDFVPSGSYQFDQAALIAVAGPGTENSSVFQVEIADCEPPSSGDLPYWIVVEAAGENGDSYDQGFPAPFPHGARRAAFLPSTAPVLSEGQNIIYVDDSNTSGTEDGSISHPYNTIQEGVDAAPPEYEIWVDDSGNVYNETVTMKTGAILKSVNWDDTDGSNRAVIDPPNDNNTWPVKFNTVDNALLQGFTIGFAGVNSSPYYTEMVHLNNSDDCTIIDCLFTGKTDVIGVYSIWAADCDSLTIANCRFDGLDKDTLDTAMTSFTIIQLNNCPGIVIRNNVFTKLRNASDGSSKDFTVVRIDNTTGITFKNNLLHHIVPHAPDNVIFGYGYYFFTCSDIDVINNTVDYISVTDAIFIQQVFCYWFDTCSNETYDNNIISRVYSNAFPPVLGRGVDAHYGDVVTLNYTDIYDTVVNYYGDVVEGTGYFSLNPLYNDPDNEDYDLQSGSPCQAGDPSITDWDDGGGGGSRMGCHGGPGGEFVGLLTP